MTNEAKAAKASGTKTVVEWLPLYARPEGAERPLDAYIVLNVETGRLRTATRAPGADLPPEAAQGLEHWIPVDPRALNSALIEFFESDETRALVQRVVAGIKRVKRKAGVVYRLNADAKAALQTLEERAKTLPTGVVHDPWEEVSRLYHKDALGLHYINGKLLRWRGFYKFCDLFREKWHEGGRWHFVPGGVFSVLHRLANENEELLETLDPALVPPEDEEDSNPKNLRYGGTEVELWHDDAGEFVRFTLFFPNAVSVDVVAEAAAAFGLIQKEPSWLRRHGVAIFAVDEWPVLAPAWPWGRTPHQSQEWRVFVRKTPFEGPSKFDGRTTVLE